MLEIKTVAILGANGAMGSGCAGLIAAFGEATVFMVARNIDKAKAGIEKAIESVRSDMIRRLLIPATYEDLPNILPKADWIFELVNEDYTTKDEINRKIAKYRKQGTLVSTSSSGLSIARLANQFDNDGKKRYLGIHFYNPPYKMLLCELVNHEKTDRTWLKEVEEYLKLKLLRKVVNTADTPGFAGNRIGFQLMNEIALFAEKYQNEGGIALMDRIIGCYSGRAMPPLVTVDLVGLDIHKAIVNNIVENVDDPEKDTFVLPKYMSHLINLNKLGKKTGEGLYKTVQYADGKKGRLVYDIRTNTYLPLPKLNLPFVDEATKKVADGDYRGAMTLIRLSQDSEATILRYFIARYLSYSFSLIGKVVPDRESVDKVMGYGFNWMPPSAYIDFIGGIENARKILDDAGIPVPQVLKGKNMVGRFYTLQNELDARSFFKAK